MYLPRPVFDLIRGKHLKAQAVIDHKGTYDYTISTPDVVPLYEPLRRYSLRKGRPTWVTYHPNPYTKATRDMYAAFWEKFETKYQLLAADVAVLWLLSTHSILVQFYRFIRTGTIQFDAGMGYKKYYLFNLQGYIPQITEYGSVLMRFNDDDIRADSDLYVRITYDPIKGVQCTSPELSLP